MNVRRLGPVVAAAALLAAGSAAQATTVTYTFTEFNSDQSVRWQLRHSLDHFLDPATFEHVHFTLADIVVDPWAPFGLSTQELDDQGFSAFPGFVLFEGANFFAPRFPQYPLNDPGNQIFAVSFDMTVLDRTAGSWREGRNRVDVTVADAPPAGTVPEPASLPLLATALAALALVRRTQRTRRG